MKSPAPKNRPISHAKLWLLAVVVGVVAGSGAVLFRMLIGFFHNLLFLGSLSALYDANRHTPASPWGIGVICVPVIGAVGVAFLVKNYAMEAKGHGVPEVMDAIYYQKGVIRPVVALIKSLASALSIGSGGSVGREGPIVQIGSSFGSSTGQLLRLPAWQRITMIAAGAGGGIAATFNTPIGGVLFAAELLLHEVSVWTLVPVVISTATATYVGRLFLGTNPSFVIPALEAPYFHVTNPFVLLAHVGLGCLMGVVSVFFIKSIYGFEDFFEQRIRGNYYTRHVTGMLIVGVMIYLLNLLAGHYYVAGIGYATVQDVLSGAMTSIFLLLALFFLKVFATALTLGSGGSGGIFSPLLFLGATFGGAYGVMLKGLFSGLPINPPAFAVAGMAGAVGGATGAAMTAIVMIFEMTLDYRVILPMTITVAISYGVRKFLSKESIYTLKLARRGHYMPEALQADFHLVRMARDLMQSHPVSLPASAPLEALGEALSVAHDGQCCLVENNDRLVGVVVNDASLQKLIRHGNSLSAGDLASTDYEIVAETTTLFEMISKMRSRPLRAFLVASKTPPDSPADIKGAISTQQITNSIAESIGIWRE